MKRKYLVVLLVLLFSVVAFVCYYSNSPCYKPAEKQTGLYVLHHKDDTIRIAYIGDSWAYNHIAMKCVIDSMIHDRIGRSVQIRTAGVPGLVSKEIYYAIFTNGDLRSVIEWGPDFCFVSSGVNDSNLKLGRDNYKENMRLLIRAMLDHNITPVILEIPYYDVYYTFWRRPPISLFRSIRSMLCTQSAINCIDSYSNSYNDLIIEQQWLDSVITIRRSYWNPNGYNGQKELYTLDRMHLTRDGYYVLDSCIASQIVTFLNHRNIKSIN